MGSALKTILWIVGGLALLLVAAVVAATFLLDAKVFRSRISAQVQQATGRTLQLGDIHMSVFPTLGATITNASLGNAAGFGDEPFATIGSAEVGVRLIPLVFHHDIQVGRVKLKDMQLNLVRHADGKSNWEDFSSKTAISAGQQAQTAAAPAQAGANQNIDVSGVDLDNASINYQDQQAKKSYALSKFNLSTGAISLGQAVDLKLGFKAVSTDPQLSAEVSVSASVSGDTDKKVFDLDKLEAAVDATGKGVPGGRQQLKLTGGLHYDAGQDSFKLSGGKLSVASLDLALNLDGRDLGGKGQQIDGPLSVAQFEPRGVLKALGMDSLTTADPDALKSMSLSAQLQVSANGARLNQLNLKLDQSTLTGSLAVDNFAAPAILFALKLDQIDADRYLAPPAAGGGMTAAQARKAGVGDAQPLPVDAIDGFDASGNIDIAKFKFDKLNMSDARLHLVAARHAAKRIDLSASAYSGSISSGTRIVGGSRPSYGETLKLVNIEAGPLLKDFMGKDSVSGQGSFSLDVTSAGRTVGEVKRALNGDLSFSLQNGAVKGFNLAKMMRQGQALMNAGQGGGTPDLAGGNDDSQQTDFSTFSGSGKFVNGVLHSDQLNAQGPLFRVSGAGSVDLPGNSIDYLLKPTLVNTATGQGGKDLSQLEQIVIPIQVSGSLSAPRYQLDLAALLQQSAVQKLGQQISKKLGGNAGKFLNGLFGGQQQQQQQPQQQNPQGQ